MTATPPAPAPQASLSAKTSSAALGPTPNLWRRMACWLYEGMLMFGVVFIAGYLFGTLSQTRHAL
ncbi:MAG: RDD family protein, partial [Betaproteobacteria bacterium]